MRFLQVENLTIMSCIRSSTPQKRQAALDDVKGMIDLLLRDSQARHEADRVLARGEQEHPTLAREADELAGHVRVVEREPTNEAAPAHLGLEQRGEPGRQALEPRRQVRAALRDVRHERPRGKAGEDVVPQSAGEWGTAEGGPVRA
jgi:hypothetical protein